MAQVVLYFPGGRIQYIYILCAAIDKIEHDEFAVIEH